MKPPMLKRFMSNGIFFIIAGSFMIGSFMTFSLILSRWARDL